jgi:predicted GIY-YIG superfamily endonuclease
MYIYILKLEGGKYYVGKTNNVDQRLQQHFDGTFGSAWTRLHRPIALFDEKQGDGYIKILMSTIPVLANIIK